MENLLAKYNFTPEEISDFISNGLVIKCPRKTILLQEGAVPRYFYWATKGIFREGFTDQKGNDFTRAFFTPETFPFVTNYGSFVFQRPSLGFLECIEEGEVLSWRYEYINKLVETDFKWLRFFKKQADRVIYFIEVKEMHNYTLTPEEKYKAFLETSSDILNRVPQHYVASYLGISPEALSRIRNRINTKK
jgi:CRP/FNR family transcriptional regulator, cyclic AMP receptor protein